MIKAQACKMLLVPVNGSTSGYFGVLHASQVTFQTERCFGTPHRVLMPILTTAKYDPLQMAWAYASPGLLALCISLLLAGRFDLSLALRSCTPLPHRFPHYTMRLCKVVWKSTLSVYRVCIPPMPHRQVWEVFNTLIMDTQWSQGSLVHGFTDQSCVAHAEIWSLLPFMAFYALCNWQVMLSGRSRRGHARDYPPVVDPTLSKSDKSSTTFRLCPLVIVKIYMRWR